MASISIGIISDTRRKDMGVKLSDLVDADFLSVDDGSLGCTQNHARAWRQHSTKPADWNLNLEDDAVPVENFRDQLDKALEAAPTPIVSLYLGGGYIGDNMTGALLDDARAIGAHWAVTKGGILHAVALAVRQEILASMIEYLGARTRAVDSTLSTWALNNSYEVGYSIPSLVDHADEKSLVTKYRRSPRRAFMTGRRDEWCSKLILMS
jgi:GR25 family glycosyltransferase involved in LPS biosynthesis